jgi:hypothetical protein
MVGIEVDSEGFGLLCLVGQSSLAHEQVHHDRISGVPPVLAAFPLDVCHVIETVARKFLVHLGWGFVAGA